MQCIVCGRMLKSSKSKELGYGPVCYRKVFGCTPRIQDRSEESSHGEVFNYDIPGQITVEDYLQTLTGV